MGAPGRYPEARLAAKGDSEMARTNTVTEAPYDARGNLIHFPADRWPDQPAQWRPNEPFTADLRVDTVQSGRSAKYLIWLDEDDRRFPMFVADAVDVMRFASVTGGRTGPRRWIVRKRGRNYGVALAPAQVDHQPADAATDGVFDRAVDAAAAVIAEHGHTPPGRDVVAAALRAAGTVYDAEHDRAVQDMMDRSLTSGMRIGEGAIHIDVIMAREIAVTMAFAAAQFLNEFPDAENYVQQDVWDNDRVNRYTVIFVRPGRRTPHELRRDAERQRDRLRAVLAQTIAALHVALNHNPADQRPEADDEIAGCREALQQARDLFPRLGGIDAAPAQDADQVPLRELVEAVIDEAAGAAYEIGHAHGGNPYRRSRGEPPQRVDDGWDTAAHAAVEKLMAAVRDGLVDLEMPVS
jgi:hypothetical protein